MTRLISLLPSQVSSQCNEYVARNPRVLYMDSEDQPGAAEAICPDLVKELFVMW